jgi:hypothetical protein
MVLDDDQELVESYCVALRQLVLCAEQFSSINEKVAVSAMAALRELRPLQLAEIVGKTGLVGKALATCIKHVYEVRVVVSHSVCSAVSLSEWSQSHV